MVFKNLCKHKITNGSKMQFNNTIKRYLQALLNFLNETEIQYKDSKGNLITSKVPFIHSYKEKLIALDSKSDKQLLNGNLNVLPRGCITLSTITRNPTRSTNKNLKINTMKTKERVSYQYNCVPYDLAFDCSVLCRGLTEVFQIIEQIAPRFNPNLALDIYDGYHQDEPSRIAIQLLDVSIEPEEYEEFSEHKFTLNLGFQVSGNLYQQPKTYDLIKEFVVNYRDYTTKQANDVKGSNVSGATGNPLDEDTIFDNSIQVNDITKDGNTYKVDYTSGKFVELHFKWVVDGEEIDNDKDTLTIENAKNVECAITDVFGNFKSIQKEFRINIMPYSGETLED